ncbi:MAG TPA: DISARM system helicase DrmA [Acidimicrobiales bacterium]|nr:DISARM system helicase DrmA [Acidimicrobiales bacterium]
MSTTTTPVGSFEVRAELERLLERDLLGPWDGPEEELPPGSSPAERYLLGRLVPRRNLPAAPAQTLLESDPDLVDREVVDAAEDLEEPESPASIRAGTMAASSLGLSFWVATDVDAIRVVAEWGRYERGPSTIHETEQGRPRTVWRRASVTGKCDISLTVEADSTCSPVADQERVVIRASVRHRGARRVVDLALVNNQPQPAATPDTARLYQVSLTVTAEDGTSAIFVGHNDPEIGDRPLTSDDERLRLALLYRRHREYAQGRQCAVDVDVRDGELRAWRLRTTSFPAADVHLTVPADATSMPGLVLDMARLGSPELARDELVRALRPLVSGYRTWLDVQRSRLGSDAEVRLYDPAGPQMLELAEGIAGRLERAIDLLRDDPMAREAFRFANQAMALQRVRTEVVRVRLADPGRSLGDVLTATDVPAGRSWRPFQLAFVLLSLPGLTNPDHPDAHRGIDDGQVLLLFFPTGGGKTESYLGLAAYTFALRRLQGVVGEGADARDGSDGVAVLMRYTLRLLTAQQFQRAASLICACEWLRRERVASGDGRWGATPFRVGLWVGSSVTPNSFDEAQRQLDDARSPRDSVGGALQLVACPWCGSSLSGENLHSDKARRRVLLFCSDPEGDCVFTQRHSPADGIPVVTVDEEIYRLTPALVISTVDKFAQLPWKAASALLFGLVDERCPRHGWRNPDFDPVCRGRHNAAGNLPATQPEPALRLRPPDLIIQDELHLISDALGSMVGLFETVIDRMCTRRHQGREIRPVVVASTATVRRAADQVEQVFGRDLAVFPPQVIDAGETFFATSVPPTRETPSRRYRGILATGERLTAVEIRVAAAALEHAQFLFDRYGADVDPYMTVVDYFTSTRELAGMRRLVDDDIADRLASQSVRTRRRRPVVAELTSRMPSDRIASTLADLERPFDPSYDTTAAVDQLRAEARRGAKLTARRPDGMALPMDVLLATSMLQVGVDVPRLGLMLVTGQPKNTAEYIQATSRVGRDPRRPGLIITIYQWARPRDLAHYETFGSYHDTFGARVEGLTTTPFSDRALDRGLTAVLVAAVRQSGTATLPNTAAQYVSLDGPSIELLLDAIEARATRVTHDAQRAGDVRRRLRHRLEKWQERRHALTSGVLGYQVGPDVTGLLRPPEEGSWDRWTAPRSLREVEPEVLLQLQRTDRSVDSAPPWQYDTVTGDQP